MLLSALREWDRRLECLGVVNQPQIFAYDFEVWGCIVRFVRNNGFRWRYVRTAGSTRVRVKYIQHREPVQLDFEVNPVGQGFTITCYFKSGAQLGTPQFISGYSSEQQCNDVIAAFFRLCDSVPEPVD
jgi:hypothetical protein